MMTEYETMSSHAHQQDHPSDGVDIPQSIPRDVDLEPATRTTSIAGLSEKSQPPKSCPREILFVCVLCFAQLLTQAGLAQSIAPMTILGRSFGTEDAGELSWMSAAYSLTVGTFILIAGRLGDLFGHKELFIAGFSWFALWSLLAGVSVWTNQIFFDICRAFQGMGPAFCVPNAVAIIGRTYPEGRKQAMIFSIFGATAPGGFVLGAVFSSIFAQFLWWPWAFWVMAMVCLVIAATAVFAIPPTPQIHRPKVSLWELTDASGAATAVIGLVLVNFAWNQGPVVGWQTSYVYALLIVGVVFLAFFLWNEKRATYPLLPREIFNGRTGFVLGCVAAGWSSFGIWLFYLWQIFLNIRGHTPLLASAQFTAAAVSGACAAIACGLIIGRVRPGLLMLVAMTAFTVGTVIIATTPASQVYWAQTFVSIIIMPWGMDISFPAATILISNSVPKEHQGVAASLVNTVINYSISIGLGIAGTVEREVTHSSSNPDLLTGYRSAFYVGIGLAGLGVFLATMFVLWEQVKRKQGK